MRGEVVARQQRHTQLPKIARQRAHAGAPPPARARSVWKGRPPAIVGCQRSSEGLQRGDRQAPPLRLFLARTPRQKSPRLTLDRQRHTSVVTPAMLICSRLVVSTARLKIGSPTRSQSRPVSPALHERGRYTHSASKMQRLHGSIIGSTFYATMAAPRAIPDTLRRAAGSSRRQTPMPRRNAAVSPHVVAKSTGGVAPWIQATLAATQSRDADF